MVDIPRTPALERVRQSARPARNLAAEDDALIGRLAGARFVLLGEASHGTHEFYLERAAITRRLIAEAGFNAVAVEADWPDAYRVNRYVRGEPGDADAEEALRGFQRFPAWMWRNADVLDFVGWLRGHNETVGDAGDGARQVGFYGLDLYSLHASMEAVIGYLDRVDPEAARRARARYGCFDRFGGDPQEYGYAALFGEENTCEREVLRQLVDLRRGASGYARRDGPAAADEFFHAEQNARLVADAERYYRAMFGARVSSWNLRDTHMADTLDALVDHLTRRSGARGPAKVVVWAHNSHLGDARATEMGEGGELNLGQLVRERHPGLAALVGFTTYSGTVTAAPNWDAPAGRVAVRPALPGSVEALFHEAGPPRFWLPTRDDPGLAEALGRPMLERAIGVIYRPQTERASHYFHARPAAQFDALIHVDRTRAVEPLERTAGWEAGEVPETFPSGV